MSTQGDALGDAIKTGLDAVGAPAPGETADQYRTRVMRAMGNAIWDALGGATIMEVGGDPAALGGVAAPVKTFAYDTVEKILYFKFDTPDTSWVCLAGR